MFRRGARKVAKRRYAKKRQLARKKFPRSGVIRLTRMCQEQNVYNTATTAVAQASGSVVLIGTPYQTPAFVGSTYYNIPFSIETQLDDLLASTELTQIADKYRINWVKIAIMCTSNTASAGSVAQLPSILYSLDEDDAGIPASTTVGLNLLREKMAAKVKMFKRDSPLTIFYRPKIVSLLNNAVGVAQSASVSGPRFLDCNSPSIPHYGVKGYLQDVNLASTASVYTQFKFNISMSVTLKDIQ